MSKIIAICGKICCGKSYYAKQIKEKENAVILSIDEATYDLIDNEQGEFYNAFAEIVNKYLMKKAVEIVKAERQETTKYFNQFGIDVEWHYVGIEQLRWKQLIEERNNKIKNGNGGSDFYVDEGLMEKLLSKFEEPTRDEINVRIETKF